MTGVSGRSEAGSRMTMSRDYTSRDDIASSGSRARGLRRRGRSPPDDTGVLPCREGSFMSFGIVRGFVFAVLAGAAAQTPAPSIDQLQSPSIAGVWVLNPALTQRPEEIGFSRGFPQAGGAGGDQSGRSGGGRSRRGGGCAGGGGA